MQKKTNELCILGGGYFTLGYLLNQIQNFFEKLLTYDFVTSFLGGVSIILDIVFITLFLICLIKKQNFMFFKSFINRFLKISIYLYYIGICGYIIFMIDILLLFPIHFISISETAEKYLMAILAIINIGGVLTAFILASFNVFFKSKCKKIIH